ncbi:actin-like ATPase domain-containing protein [Macrolepiota fuliginosa MF-IS2]|uniref:Actin-like ATPase domain-containing protein n=1 Tax=Macrolepiota fuliginosa MF-IS2 TaxID=1400762 RepID=A0A9P5XR96_9AGAR|nr:actin-like ATPase domain-containing protein [Macrolepiota fuliginosa MF-IS2]
MPRGVPNVKKDETGLRYTTFNVPLSANPKHVNSTYLKSDTQTLWSRNASQRLREGNNEDTSTSRRGSQVIIIHPGSGYIRIGKASDVVPVSVPCVVARKCRTSAPKVTRVQNVARPRSQMTEEEIERQQKKKDEGKADDKDPFDAKLAAVTGSLKERMRFFKLRATPNATTISVTFNKQFQPETIPEHNDASRVDWIDHTSTEDILIGDEALRIGDPEGAGYVIRRPIYNRNFNFRDYPSTRVILSDLEAIIRMTLQEKHDLEEQDYKNYSAILVIPDLYDRAYVHDFIDLLVSMGFKRFCAQQESLAATYGAGISNACVVDIGASTTSIACVDEGLVIADTRMRLGVGGDDITEFLYVLLRRIHLPYREMDLVRSYDWNVMEELKAQICTLTESDVAVNLYGFTVRQPNQPTVKYGFRVYDEVILAPMCLFEPRIIEFEDKRPPIKNTPNSMTTDEIVDHTSDLITNAMIISTRHLMPPPSENAASKSQPVTAQTSGTSTPGKLEPEQPVTTNGASRSTSQTPTEVQVEVTEENAKANPQPSQSTEATPPVPTQAPVPVYAGGYNIDVPFEASKLPLDVAIFNCVRAAGDERIRKYLQAVLLIGGTAQIPGIGLALESRLQAIATPVVSGMEKVQVIPPPKDVNPQILAWKGAAVLGKMESVSELWVTPTDWEILGMRGLKERCFFL